MSNLRPSVLKALKESVIGHFDEIASDTNKSKSLVSLVLSGKRRNNQIIDKAIEVKERLRKEAEDRERRILA